MKGNGLDVDLREGLIARCGVYGEGVSPGPAPPSSPDCNRWVAGRHDRHACALLVIFFWNIQQVGGL